MLTLALRLSPSQTLLLVIENLFFVTYNYQLMSYWFLTICYPNTTVCHQITSLLNWYYRIATVYSIQTTYQIIVRTKVCYHAMYIVFSIRVVVHDIISYLALNFSEYL